MELVLLMLILGTAIEEVISADGDIVLSGTLVLKGGAKCLKDDFTAVDLGDGTACVQLIVSETATADQYMIKKLSPANMRGDNQMNLTPGSNAFSNTGTTIIFSDGSAAIGFSEAMDKLTQDAMPVFVLLPTDDATSPGTDASKGCLKATGTYALDCTGTKENDQWYFVKVPCTISNCEECLDALQCTHCNTDTHVLDENMCKACADKFDKCSKCSDVSGTAKCMECTSKYVVKTDGSACEACDDANCDICSEKDECTTCMSGYTVENDGCVACEKDHCDTCADKTKCTKCMSGYTVENDGCVACTKDHCVTCAVKDTCTECMSGYTVENDGCVACEKDHCDTCADKTKCTKCMSGYTVENDGCVECADKNCDMCSAKDTCDKCMDGTMNPTEACKATGTTQGATEGSAALQGCVLMLVFNALLVTFIYYN